MAPTVRPPREPIAQSAKPKYIVRKIGEIRLKESELKPGNYVLISGGTIEVVETMTAWEYPNGGTSSPSYSQIQVGNTLAFSLSPLPPPNAKGNGHYRR